jgi:nicotinamidase-related amidase
MAEQLTINRKKTAVLVMDFQLRQVNALNPETRAALIPAVNNVLDKVRAAGLPVIFVEVVRGERMPDNALSPEVKPQKGEPVLTKSRTAPWTTTNLNEILKEKGVDTIVLMGINTSRVILVTLCFASDMDYKTIILADGCADADPQFHDFLMENIFPRWANVTQSAKFLQALESSK